MRKHFFCVCVETPSFYEMQQRILFFFTNFSNLAVGLEDHTSPTGPVIEHPNLEITRWKLTFYKVNQVHDQFYKPKSLKTEGGYFEQHCAKAIAELAAHLS